MNKLINRLAIIGLTSTLGISSGCGIEDKSVNTIPLLEETKEQKESNLETSVEELEGKEEISLLEKNNIEYVDYATAIEDVNIRDTDNEIVGVLPKGHSIKKIGEDLEKVYVNYYDQECSISKKYVEDNTFYTITSKLNNIAYTPNGTILTIPDYISLTGKEEVVEYKELESFEVYGEEDDSYLVKVDNLVGYVKKDTVTLLPEKVVVVDISDQELKFYLDNELVLDTPVVTGKPSTPSDLGLFEIYDITHNRYLIGPNYKTYVDFMVKYNGGEGLHDAQYHKNKDGKSHGWRSLNEFGGNTYLSDGSHGCINMIHDDVEYIYENVEVGTKVLVKE